MRVWCGGVSVSYPLLFIYLPIYLFILLSIYKIYIIKYFSKYMQPSVELIYMLQGICVIREFANSLNVFREFAKSLNGPGNSRIL